MAHRRPLRAKDRALPPLRFVDRATATAGLALRGFAGAHVAELGPRPGAPLRLRSLANPSSDVAHLEQTYGSVS
jgi:hypothetical protein